MTVRREQAIVSWCSYHRYVERIESEFRTPVLAPDIRTDRSNVGGHRLLLVKQTDGLYNFPMPKKDTRLS